MSKEERNMYTIRQQTGMTPMATFVIIVVVGFGVYLALKIVPLYLEYFNVASSINSLKDDPDLSAKSTSKIRVLIRKRFEVNDVKRVTSQDVKIKKSGGGVIVIVQYEARVSIVANIDLVASFHKRSEF
jgi:hypothetical protein